MLALTTAAARRSHSPVPFLVLQISVNGDRSRPDGGRIVSRGLLRCGYSSGPKRQPKQHTLFVAPVGIEPTTREFKSHGSDVIRKITR